MTAVNRLAVNSISWSPSVSTTSRAPSRSSDVRYPTSAIHVLARFDLVFVADHDHEAVRVPTDSPSTSSLSNMVWLNPVVVFVCAVDRDRSVLELGAQDDQRSHPMARRGGRRSFTV